MIPQFVWNLSMSASGDQRDAMIRFWLAAPSDQLEALWALPFGEVTKQLVRQLDSSHSFTSEQVSLRNELGARFSEEGLSQPLAPQLMLANFLLSPPGLLRINNVDQFFPEWLIAAYQDLYEAVQTAQLQDPSSLNAAQLPQTAPVEQQLTPSPPDFGSFPSSLQELISNRIQLNRLLGLSNLYYIDPEDQEIRVELEQVRSSLADCIKRCPESELQSLWSTDLGDRYWALVRSGLQKEVLSVSDEERKQQAVHRLDAGSGGGFGTPGAINAFLIAMMYFLPGAMKVDGAEQKIPAWLLPSYQQIFAQAISA